MAERLGLDPTYLSQLENSHRNVDDFYLSRAAQVVEDFEKTNKVKGDVLREETPPALITSDLVDRIRGYINRVIHEYGTDQDRLSWILIELTRHFPLPARTQPAPSSESLYSAAARFSSAAEKALELERPGHSRSPAVDVPIEQKSEPSPGGATESKGKQSPPGPAPKSHKL